MYTRSDVKGNDLNCGQTNYEGEDQPWCKICSSVAPLPIGAFRTAPPIIHASSAQGDPPAFTPVVTPPCPHPLPPCTPAPSSPLPCPPPRPAPWPCPTPPGDLAEVEAACRDNPQCKSFAYDGYCGYLKSIAAPNAYREGYFVAAPV